MFLQDGPGDLHEGSEQDRGSRAADLRPGRKLHVQPRRLAAVPSGSRVSFGGCVGTAFLRGGGNFSELLLNFSKQPNQT